MTVNNPFFETADLNIAAYLLTKKILFRGSYLAKDGRTIFRFRHDDRINDFIDDYAYGGEVPAKDLVASFHFLTGQIKQNRRNGGVR